MENPFDIIDTRLANIEAMLIGFRIPTPEGGKWMDIDQLLEYLPYKPAKATVYAYVSKREIPYHKQGKQLYFSVKAIDEWLDEGLRKTKNQTDNENYLKPKK